MEKANVISPGLDEFAAVRGQFAHLSEALQSEYNLERETGDIEELFQEAHRRDPEQRHPWVMLTEGLELTNEPYAIAKIAGIKLCESYNRQYGTHYRSLMPTNL